jgi:predicted transcriptional regulator
MAKREKLEIVQDILKTIKKNKNEIKPTPLLRKTNISSARFKTYYNDLIKRGLIKVYQNKNSQTISLTDKGEQFLKKYQTIISFIEEFGIK